MTNNTMNQYNRLSICRYIVLYTLEYISFNSISISIRVDIDCHRHKGRTLAACRAGTGIAFGRVQTNNYYTKPFKSFPRSFVYLVKCSNNNIIIIHCRQTEFTLCVVKFSQRNKPNSL